MVQDAKITKYLILVLTLFSHSVIAACPENCNSCDEQDSCTSCKTGHWDLENRCHQTCSSYCLNNDCKTDNGYCIACKTGFYGSLCNRDCSLCDDGLCGSLSCTKGCKDEYYEYQDTVDTFCLRCATDCRSCSNTSACNVCNDGFFLFKHNITGNVKVVCVSCYDKTECSNFCSIQNCKQCQIQVDSRLLCTQCFNGYRYNGQICIPNESTCAQGCSTDCDENGLCKGSCNAGYTGERCSDLCASQCLKCSKYNAYICEECKLDYYTVRCNVECDQACIKETGKHTCKQNDGYCLNGCENTFWGQNCNLSCSDGCVDNRLSQLCDRDNAKCTNGCVDGYHGDKCEIIVSEKSTVQTSVDTSTTAASMWTNIHGTSKTETPTCEQCHGNKDTTTSFITGYMSGFGTALFLFIITAAIYHLKRRYIAKKSEPYQEGNAPAEMSTYYNENASETREPPVQLAIDANNYESLTSNRNTDKVYSELESKAEQERHSYYNMDDTK